MIIDKSTEFERIIEIETGGSDKDNHLSESDIYEILLPHKYDKIQEFKDCLTRPGVSRPEWGNIEFSIKSITWSESDGIGSIYATCVWTEYLGCKNMDGNGEEEAIIDLKYIKLNGILKLSALITPPAPSTHEEF